MPNDAPTLLTNKLTLLKAKRERGEPILSEDKIKVAVLADSPTVVTGFGNVCREVLGALYDTGFYDFDVVGINYAGEPHTLPYRIFPAINALMPDPAYREVFGRQRFLDMLGEGRFDLVWVLQDSFVVNELSQRIVETNEQLPADKEFAFIYYFPIDAVPKKEWIDHTALLADFPVVYTRYGYDEIMKLYAVDQDTKLTKDDQTRYQEQKKLIEAKLQIIYHGCNTRDFYPITDADEVQRYRKQYWDEHAGKFVFINVNRNQPRKDLFRTMLAFKKLLDRRRAKGKNDVYLYLHCNLFDTGLHLIDMGKQLDLVEGNEYAFPDPKVFTAASGFPIQIVNQLYNASDAVVSTTLGEGWGLSLTEGMAVKKPVIAPDHTSIPEILGKTNAGGAERGVIVKTAGVFVQHDDNSRVRPYTDADDLADKMEYVVEHRDELQPVVDAAYAWVKALDWKGDVIGAQWRAVFEQAYERTLMYRAVAIDQALGKEIQAQKLSRNDLCPICHVKIKKCRHGTQN